MKWFWRILGGLALVLVAAFFVLRVPDTDAGAMYAKYGTPPSQMLGIDRTRRVHVRDEGPRDAPVVILLHGSMPISTPGRPGPTRSKATTA